MQSEVIHVKEPTGANSICFVFFVFLLIAYNAQVRLERLMLGNITEYYNKQKKFLCEMSKSDKGRFWNSFKRYFFFFNLQKNVLPFLELILNLYA